MKVRILLVDDHKILRDGLKKLLDKQNDFEIVGEAENGRMAFQCLKKLSPDLVIMDISMPDMNGIEAARLIKKDYPHIKIIALSMHSDRRFVQEMLQAGVSGYLLKELAFDELVKAIETVMNNQFYLSSSISYMILQNFIQNPSDKNSSVFAKLTPREREILQLLAEGKSTKIIAAKLNVSIKTVESHRQQIKEKLNIHSIAELTKYAIREGLTTLDI